MREDNVALAVAPQVEQVAGQGSPQVDAGEPGQQGFWKQGVKSGLSVCRDRLESWEKREEFRGSNGLMLQEGGWARELLHMP